MPGAFKTPTLRSVTKTSPYFHDGSVATLEEAVRFMVNGGGANNLAIADMTQVREAAMQEAVPGLPSPIQTTADDSSAQKMETVRNLISEDPNRVAQVVKHWVNDESE